MQEFKKNQIQTFKQSLCNFLLLQIYFHTFMIVKNFIVKVIAKYIYHYKLLKTIEPKHNVSNGKPIQNRIYGTNTC